MMMIKHGLLADVRLKLVVPVRESWQIIPDHAKARQGIQYIGTTGLMRHKSRPANQMWAGYCAVPIKIQEYRQGGGGFQ